MNGDFPEPERGYEAEIGRGAALAGLERHLAGSQVLAGGSDIVSGAAGAIRMVPFCCPYGVR